MEPHLKADHVTMHKI